MKKASKTGTQILILLSLWVGKSCVADNIIRAEEDHFSLPKGKIETGRAKGITNIYRRTGALEAN